MNDHYGKRNDDIMMPEMTPEVLASLTDSQRMNVRIIQSLTNINNNISTLTGSIDSIKADVSVHDKILVTGNGEPSIQERIRNIESYINGVRYWSRLVGGAILLQTITFGVATIIAIVRILPLLEKLVTP